MNYSNIVTAVSDKLVKLDCYAHLRTAPAKMDKTPDGSNVQFRLYNIRVDCMEDHQYFKVGQYLSVEMLQAAMDTVVPTPEWFVDQLNTAAPESKSVVLHDTLEQAVEASGYMSYFGLFEDVYQAAVEKAVGRKALFASSADLNYKSVGIFLQDEEMVVSLKMRVK